MNSIGKRKADFRGRRKQGEAGNRKLIDKKLVGFIRTSLLNLEFCDLLDRAVKRSYRGSKYSRLLGVVSFLWLWLWRSEPPNVSRDFWMPDQSCRCTANSVPAPSDEPRAVREDWERIRVCNYCFKQWEQGIATTENGTIAPSPGLSPSPSATSLVSTKSSCTGISRSSTVGSTPYSTGPYHRVNYNSVLSPCGSAQMNGATEENNDTFGSSTNPSSTTVDSSSNHIGFCGNRSDDEDDDYAAYRSDLESRQYAHSEEYYGAINVVEINSENSNVQSVDEIKKFEEVNGQENAKEGEDPAYEVDGADVKPVDFENNMLLWLPPEPEDEEDEREAALFDDDDDDEGATGEWGYLRSSNSFGSAEYRSRDKFVEEHRQTMKNVVEGHFRALVAQLLQVENLSVDNEDGAESWLDIIVSLSWEAATLLKPDTSKGGGMDPGGYVKVKCIASGHRSESAVVKGVVCKKNVAHRRMTSKIDKPRFLILGGALEYQRISNHLSSFDTLLQQEVDHLKMAVAKITQHGLAKITQLVDPNEVEVAHSPQSALPTMGLETMEKSMSRASMQFPIVYNSFNKKSLFNAQKLNIGDYKPVYVLSFRELERQSGARLLLPIGVTVNDAIVPVYDDENFHHSIKHYIFIEHSSSFNENFHCLDLLVA
ncbi:hypothetical protein V6N11_057565 [Hibiscus sabdariffa]|uniref:Uncharacterized protein n=1 Tax=Hibiscus sabdariffa TaxID=183260 RepID=A0ABR2NIA0_9ROSI